MGPVVRTKDLVKVKGMLINPDLLLATLPAIGGLDEFQVVVRRRVADDPFSMDELAIRVATVLSDRDELAERIVRCTATAVGVRPIVEFVEALEIYNPQQTKLRRFIDAR